MLLEMLKMPTKFLRTRGFPLLTDEAEFYNMAAVAFSRCPCIGLTGQNCYDQKITGVYFGNF